MRKFLVRGFLFGLPFGLLLGFPLFVLWASGELIPPAEIVEMQKQAEPILYHTAYSNQNKALQLTAVLKHRPEVLALGNSRVSQFRSAFFHDSVRFYNATMTVTDVSDLSYVLSQIHWSQEPSLIIAGLDHWFFNENFWDYDREEIPARFEAESPQDIYERYWQSIWLDFLGGRFNLGDVMERGPAIGLDAKVRSLGFRNDGSLYYGNIIEGIMQPMPRSVNFRATFKLMEYGPHGGPHGWRYGQEISREALRELRQFLEACAGRGIYVIGFLPMYAHAVWAKIQAMGEKYAYMDALPERLRPVFEEYGFEFYDFSDIRSVGATDEEMLDGKHASEKAYLRLVIKLVKQGSRLGRYTRDLDYLERRLHNAESDFCVFQQCGSRES